MYIWPFFLMAAGVGLILRARWPVARMFVSGLIVLGMVLAIVFAPQLGWNQAPAWNSFNLDDFNGSVRGLRRGRLPDPPRGGFQFRRNQFPGRTHHPAGRCDSP